MKISNFLLAGLLGLLSLSAPAGAEEAGEDGGYLKLAGAGVLVSTSPYQGGDSRVFGTPVGIWRNERFFLEGLRGGVILAENKTFRVDLIAAPRLMGYDSGDAPILDGMPDRDWSLDGGLQLKWKVPEVSNMDFHLALVADLLGRHKGYEADAGLSKVFSAKYYRLVPRIGLKWQSEEINDYYFGVGAAEAAAGRPAYSSGGGLNYYANLGVYTGFSEDWFVLIRGGVEWLADEIRDSPLVDENAVFSGLLGIARRF
jgi:outer membrane protein